MNRLTPLETCLGQVLDGLIPVPATLVGTVAAFGRILAEDVCLPHDMPPASEALRAGFAVTALDLIGASTGSPAPLAAPARVVPGAILPPGTDAVLPEDGTETSAGFLEAIRPVGPGEGMRRAGHDGRAGDLLVSAGTRLAPRHTVIVAQAGITNVAVRGPRVSVMLEDPAQAGFARLWLRALGADIVDGPADLTLRPAIDHAPQLALAPAETAWLNRDDAGLVLTVPPRFDGMVAACLGLALPVLSWLMGATPRTETRPVARKLTSTVGMSELVLLAEDKGHWLPQPAGTLTLVGLATSSAFAILPPDSEGLPPGALLAGTLLDLPFG